MTITQAIVGRRGFPDDRWLMITTPAGECVTQRELPRLAQIRAKIQSGQVLTLSVAGRPPFSLIISSLNRRRMTVTIGGEQCQAIDQGDEVANWLSDCLGTPCRLVRVADDFSGPPEAAGTLRRSDQKSFADRYPLSLISQASLSDLNSRLPQPVEAVRFRPNLVVSGCAPYAEDTWKVIRIGEVVCEVVAPCVRNETVNVDPRLGERGGEPLQTLSSYRRVGERVSFGQYLVQRGPGQIRIGSVVEVREVNLSAAPEGREPGNQNGAV